MGSRTNSMDLVCTLAPKSLVVWSVSDFASMAHFNTYTPTAQGQQMKVELFTPKWDFGLKPCGRNRRLKGRVSMVEAITGFHPVPYTGYINLKGTMALKGSTNRSLVDSDKVNRQRFSRTETKALQKCPFSLLQENLLL